MSANTRTRVSMLALVALAACSHRNGGGAHGPHVIAVQPQALDPAADKYQAEEYAAFDEQVPRRGLVVYLVGANNKPQSGRPMMLELASLGFAVVVPAYANDYDIRAKCEKRAGDPDEDCHGKARLEAFEGKDHSPHIQISRANSIEARVVAMLRHLSTVAPTGGWASYLDGEQPKWPAIVVAGHSHGSSSAALIAKVREVKRAVILSGPFDNRDGDPAAWLKWPSVTPRERVFAFSHALEEQHRGHLANWEALGLGAYGPPVRMEESGAATAPDYGGSHELITAVAGNNPHGMTAAGRVSPEVSAGRYRYEGAWKYLFGL
jgi:hypothetical protein